LQVNVAPEVNSYASASPEIATAPVNEETLTLVREPTAGQPQEAPKFVCALAEAITPKVIATEARTFTKLIFILILILVN
jgi:hypothetical protein